MPPRSTARIKPQNWTDKAPPGTAEIRDGGLENPPRLATTSCRAKGTVLDAREGDTGEIGRRGRQTMAH